MTPAFHAIEWHKIDGRGLIALVHLDRDTKDFGHLLGQIVVVDGCRYRCKGIERFAHALPWRAGDKIGLLVEKLPTE